MPYKRDKMKYFFFEQLIRHKKINLNFSLVKLNLYIICSKIKKAKRNQTEIYIFLQICDMFRLNLNINRNQNHFCTILYNTQFSFSSIFPKPKKKEEEAKIKNVK